MLDECTITVSRGRQPSDDRATSHRLPRLILAFECRNPFAPAVRFMLDGLDEVEIGRGATRSWAHVAGRLELRVRDFEISRQHVRLVRRSDGWELTDLASKNGTFVNARQTTTTMLSDGDLIELGGAVLVYRDDCHATDTDSVLDLASASSLPPALRTVSLGMEDRVNGVIKTAPSTIPILIRGETGTGKELIARAIHDLSGRRGAFVPVNCGALPRTLVESELFGSKRGAFSGAREDREGLVRRAEGGTLFLDEIAELPEESQVALLRVLQEGEVRPIGSAEAVRIDVRIVAATHQDLEARIADGRFRQDLYARLLGYVVALPPLRERREDIGTLIGTVLARIVDDPDTFALHEQAAHALIEYAYPLNIRELEQALRAAVALADRREIRIEHLPEAIRTHRRKEPALVSEQPELADRMTELLREHRGNVTAVARTLGKAPVQIRRWCRRYKIEVETFRR